MNADQTASINAILAQLGNLEQVIGNLHNLTHQAPKDAQWDQVRDAVSGLDSFADAVRQALDEIKQDSRSQFRPTFPHLRR